MTRQRAVRGFKHPHPAARESKSVMPKRDESRAARNPRKKLSSAKLGTRTKIESVALVESELVQPRVDAIETTTEVEKVPTLEVRRPATLAQALTEPATIVEKQQTRVVGRMRKRVV